MTLTNDDGALGFSGRNRSGQMTERAMVPSRGKHVSYLLSFISFSQRRKIRSRFYLREYQGADPGERVGDGVDRAGAKVRKIVPLIFVVIVVFLQSPKMCRRSLRDRASTLVRARRSSLSPRGHRPATHGNGSELWGCIGNRQRRRGADLHGAW